MIRLKSGVACLLLALVLCSFENLHAFTFQISGKNAVAGESARSSDCTLYDENAFTSDAGLTVFTDEQAYSHGMGMSMTIQEGHSGWGRFGGVINFRRCAGNAGHLVRGDEIWIRSRFRFPEGFEFNQIGRNKFLRLKTLSEQNGSASHEGYIDLYLDGREQRPKPERFHYIFEGEQRWASVGDPDDFFEPDQWHTVEMYVKLDNVPRDEGGMSRVLIWFDGELLDDLTHRMTLKTPESYVNSLYVFTYWNDTGAHATQTLYADDLVITTDTPAATDAHGNRFIGTGEFISSLVWGDRFEARE